MSFYEVLDCIEFNHAHLLQDLEYGVKPLGAQVIQGKEYETPLYHGFGGWSITSRLGEWSDGWDTFQNDGGEKMEVYLKPENYYAARKFFNIAHSLEHKHPTQAYIGEIAKVVDRMEALGLYPRRVRVTCLKAGSKSLVHSDANENEYAARIHIPLITNDKCVFICDGEHLHMEAGKAYAVWVNRWHQIRNDSDTDRYHIICDFYDTKGVTKGFKYEGDITQLEALAAEIRQKVNDSELTPELYEQFEAIRQEYITNP